MTKCLCDHCGKELNFREDYDDIDINICSCHLTVDLCSECMDKLKKIIGKIIGDFVNKDV